MALDIKISNDNLLKWSYMEDWENGTSSAPTEHTLAGSGATVARESSTVKIGNYSAAVTRSGADATLYHDYSGYESYQGRKVTFGCWVYATVASRGRISISDGVGSSNSSYHSGGSDWEFLEVTHDVDESATRIRVELQVNTGNTTVYFDGGILCEGDESFVDLDSLVDISEFTPATRYRGQQFSIPRREGRLIPNITPDGLTLNLRGMIVGSDASTTRTNKDTLFKSVNSTFKKPNDEQGFKNLFLFDDRYYRVKLTSQNLDSTAVLAVREFQLGFTADIPFELAVNSTRSATTIDSSPKSITVTPTGNTYVRPTIRVTAGSANITTIIFENLTTNQSWSYVGTITAGDTLVVDHESLTVENNGVDDVGNLTGESNLILLPMANNLKVTLTGGSTDSVVKVDFIDRWY